MTHHQLFVSWSLAPKSQYGPSAVWPTSSHPMRTRHFKKITTCWKESNPVYKAMPRAFASYMETPVASSGRWPGGADVRIVTSGGRCIPAHSISMASASPVLERKLDCQTRRGGKKTLLLLGVPSDSVEAFVRLLYMGEVEEREVVRRYGMQLLVLAHAYRVGWVKSACETALSETAAETVVDVMKLATLCDAPRLYVRCMKVVAEDFAAVERTEGWGWIQAHDPRLELEILQFLDDADMRKSRRRKRREEQEIYLQLSDAMECLQHICVEGCTIIRPHGVLSSHGKRRSGPCSSFQTCWKLQVLIRHFATCSRKRACPHCRRVWQLLRLHSYFCEKMEGCKVPLCRQFKLKSEEMDGEREDNRWRLLANKVSSIRVVNLLARRRENEFV